MDGRGIKSPRGLAAFQHRFHLTTKNYLVFIGAIEERLDADPVAHQQQSLLFPVPQTYREHPFEAAEQVISPGKISQRKQLRVSPRAELETMIALELLAKFPAFTRRLEWFALARRQGANGALPAGRRDAGMIAAGEREGHEVAIPLSRTGGVSLIGPRAREVARAFDRGSRRYIPEDLGAARIGAADDAHRRSLGKNTDSAEKTRSDADLCAIRDHGLLGLTAAVGIEDVEREIVRFEQARLVADLGNKGLANAAPADRDLELLLCPTSFG